MTLNIFITVIMSYDAVFVEFVTNSEERQIAHGSNLTLMVVWQAIHFRFQLYRTTNLLNVITLRNNYISPAHTLSSHSTSLLTVVKFV